MPTPGDILSQARSYMTSRVLLTAAELDLFSQLAGGPATAAELAERLGCEERPLTRLLDCLVTLSLLEQSGTRYRLAPDAACLAARHPASILPMVQHLSTIWDNWSQLTTCVRSGVNPQPRAVIGAAADDTRAFIQAMHVVARQTATTIAASCDLSARRQLLDIGGGSGAYTIAFLQRYPNLRGVFFDYPDVVSIAAPHIAEAGLRERVTFVGGNFYEDDLPHGSDVALLSAIIHQNSPSQNVALYTSVHHALGSGGILLIRDHVMDESRTRPPDGALFALNMLVNTPAGDTYTLAEIEEQLLQAGFSSVRLLRSGDHMDCVVEARKA